MSALSIKLSLDPATRLLSCRMTNNGEKPLHLRRPVPPLDMQISGPPGTAPHYMTLGLFSVPKITIEPGRQFTATFPLPGDIAFTTPGVYSLHFNYRSKRGGTGTTAGIDDVSAISNSVAFTVKHEDIPVRRNSRRTGNAKRNLTSVSAAKEPMRRQSRAKTGRTGHS